MTGASRSVPALLGRRLAELRVGRGLSQEELAERSGVSVRAISDLERGITRRPHRDTIAALARGLQLAAGAREELTRLARATPPARTRRKPPRVSVPAPISSILGRDEDVAGVSRLLRDGGSRLVTVLGPGGVGKSRLAAEVAWRCAAQFDAVDGADVAPLQSSADVPAALAAAVGCRTSHGRWLDAAATRIGTARWLLVVDGFEQVPDATGDLAELLARCPGLTLLVTSRVPVQLPGEQLWPLGPLAQEPAVALLVDRGRAVRPGFSRTEENAADLEQLCRRLEGLPLTIELAAAHLRTMEPAAVLAQLADQPPGHPGDGLAPAGPPSVHTTVAWGTGRLTPEARAIFAALGAFSGGTTPDCLASVLHRAGLGITSLDASLAVLSASSLVTVADRAGRVRIGMLDAVREVARSLLAESDQELTIRRAHSRHYLDLVRSYGAGECSGSAGQSKVELDLANIRTAITWALEHDPANFDPPFVRAVLQFALGRSDFRAAYQTLIGVAQVAADAATLAAALHAAGVLSAELREHRRAIDFATRAQQLFDTVADQAGRAAALTLLGNARKAVGDYEGALNAYQICLDLAGEQGDQHRITVTLNNLGLVAHLTGAYAQARDHYQRSLDLKRWLGDARGAAVTQMNLGALLADLGEFAAAREQLTESIAVLRERGEQHALGYALGLLSQAQLDDGQLAAAAESAAEGLQICQRIEYEPGLTLCLARLGDIALAQGDTESAEGLYRRALAYTAEVPETARTMERLALARAGSDPADAERLRRQAGALRAQHGTPRPPAARAAAG